MVQNVVSFVLLLCALGQVVGKVWEFGVDAPGSIVADHKEGSFSLFQKTKEIEIRSTECYEIEYVRVQVDNKLADPTVSYDKYNSTVTISYKPLQVSTSSYSVIAKAARKPGCFAAKRSGK